MPPTVTDFDFDVFISHASEDKASFVTPLAIELRKHGLKVWFDKFTLKVGDSLHRSIEKGLARSRYGVVVFSPKFLHRIGHKRNWTDYLRERWTDTKLSYPSGIRCHPLA